MPIIVRFTAPVKDRAAVEAALSVTSSKQAIEGAWSWVSDEEVHFRPKEFWPAYNNGQASTSTSRASTPAAACGAWRTAR